MRKNSLGIGVAGVAMVLVLGIGGNVAWYAAEDTQTCTVSDKTVKSDGDAGSDYRVYTKECGTFQVKDALLKGKFNSADTYGSMEVGKTYEIESVGWRFGLTSTFPNAIEVTPR